MIFTHTIGISTLFVVISINCKDTLSLRYNKSYFHSKEELLFCFKDEKYSLDQLNLLKVEKEQKRLIKMANGIGCYQPRSALARALLEKQINDKYLEEVDRSEWYKVEKSRLTPELQEKFVQLELDTETEEFISLSIDKSSWVWTQIWHILAKSVLNRFWSNTDINGWLGRGSMFVLSKVQASKLLKHSETDEQKPGAIIDVGAGDGEVSRRFSQTYAVKYATEISASMRKKLSSKGYTILDTEDWWRDMQVECVALMNLLDRCSRPAAMLRQARRALAPGGRLLLALVLPYKPYVEVTKDHKPEEHLPIVGSTFEEQVSSFVSYMATLGFELVSWSRVPYLSEGDFVQAFYWIDDSVYVFKPAPIPDDC